MDLLKNLKDDDNRRLFTAIKKLHAEADGLFREQFDRSLPLAEELSNRWQRATDLGFGQGTSIYESALVYGRPEIGTDCWIGPFTIIDGSGGLKIGNNCTVSAGTHIYSHDNIAACLTAGKAEIKRSPTSIGNCVYIGPNVVVSRGVKIGNHCLIGAFALVNRDVPDNAIVVGQPARVIGRVEIVGDEVKLHYDRQSGTGAGTGAEK